MQRAKPRGRPCRVCRRWFLPDGRLKNRQKTCGNPECQREGLGRGTEMARGTGRGTLALCNGGRLMGDILYSSCQEKNEEFINTVNSIGWM